MSDKFFITTPVGYCVKDNTLYVFTGKKEHDLNFARQVAAEAIQAKEDEVQATPPEHVPAMIKVLVMRQSVEAASKPIPAESDHMKGIVAAREGAKSVFQKSGFRGAFPRAGATTEPASAPKPDSPAGPVS